MESAHLVIINGPCGVGKTETSRELQKQLTGSHLLWLDQLRYLIPEKDFKTNEGIDHSARMGEANRLARGLAAAALTRKHTVIVEGAKQQAEWLDPWEELGRKMGVSVLEVCLMASKEVVESRAMKRGYIPGGRLTPQKVSHYYDQIDRLYTHRPQALVVDTTDRTVNETVGIIMQEMYAGTKEERV